MSYSTDTKELLAAQSVTTSDIQKSILIAFLKSNGNFEFVEDEINYNAVTETSSVARFLYKILKELFGKKLDIKYGLSRNIGNSKFYNLYVRDCKNILEECYIIDKSNPYGIDYSIPEVVLKSEYMRKGFLKGIFLSIGSLNDPQNSYHLEFVFTNERLAQDSMLLFESFGIKSRITKRREYNVLYIKEGSAIVDFLNIIGISKKALEIENIIVLRNVKNIINRRLNCDEANMKRMLKSSYRQLDAIKVIEGTIGLSKLPRELKELAECRLDNPEFDMKSLAELLNPPVSKSTVNKRFKKIEKISNDLKMQSEGEYGKN